MTKIKDIKERNILSSITSSMGLQNPDDVLSDTPPRARDMPIAFCEDRGMSLKGVNRAGRPVPSNPLK